MTRAADLDDFAATIERRFGHLPDGTRQAELARTLERRMQAAGASDYVRYRALLDRSAEEWSALAPLLTVPETYFFRLPDQFEALAGAVIPGLLRRRDGERRVRILSAGCASGEEPYSIRILLNERFQQLAAGAPGGRAAWSVAIDGFDLSESALERARVGEYSAWSLRATSEQRRREHFEQVGGGTSNNGHQKRQAAVYRLLQPARVGVSFRQVNLLEPPAPDEPRYDVIFCRNVLIYFTDRAVREAIARLTQRLLPGGYLFLGPAESLRGLSRDFVLAQTHDVFYYRLRDGVRSGPAGETTDEAEPRSEGLALEASLAPARPAGGGAGQTWYESIGTLGSRLNALMPVAGAEPDVPAASSGRRRVAAESGTRAAAVGGASVKAGSARPGSAARPAVDGFLALVAAERFGDALAVLDGEVRTAQLPGDPRLLRAAMLVHLGRYVEADRECTLLLDGGRPDASAHYLAGLCREQAGETAEAEQQMMQATYLDPGFSLPLLHRGLMAGRRGDAGTARTALNRALAALDREDEVRLTVYAGAVSRAGLGQLCRAELARLSRP